MSIAVHCDHCGKDMKVKDSLEGQRGLCPHCNSAIQVPFVATEQLGIKNVPEPEVKPPTEKQINFAHQLGIDIPPNVSRGELGRLIGEAKENAPASESQKEFLRNLGVKFPDNIRSQQMSILLDTALDLKFQVQEKVQKDYDQQLKDAGMLMEHATVEQLFKELQNRGKSFVAFVLKDDEITCHDKFPPGELHWSDDLGEEDIKFILLMLNKHWVKDFDTAKYAENFEGLVNPFEMKLRLSVRDGAR